MNHNGSSPSSEQIREFTREYAATLSDLTFNSKPVINTLTIIAGDNPALAAHIVPLIEERIRTAPGDQRLPSLYLLDSIVKNIGEPYRSLFQRNIVRCFCDAYVVVSPSTQIAMQRLLRTWISVFPQEVFKELEQEITNMRSSGAPDSYNRETSHRHSSHSSHSSHSRPHSSRAPQPHHQPPPAHYNTPYANAYPYADPAPRAYPPYHHYPYPAPHDRYAHTAYPVPQHMAHISTHAPLHHPPSNKSILPAPQVGGGEDRGRGGRRETRSTGNTGGGGANRPRSSSRSSKKRKTVSTEFTTQSLKQSNKEMVRSLYTGFAHQCVSCAFRFHDQAEMNQHMDWHFQMNRRETEKSRRAVARGWYLTTPEWAVAKGTEELVPASATSFFDASAPAEEEEQKENFDECTVVSDGTTTECSVCSEKFNTKFDDDEDEWILLNAKKHPHTGAVVHASCLTSSTDGSTINKETNVVLGVKRSPEPEAEAANKRIRVV